MPGRLAHSRIKKRKQIRTKIGPRIFIGDNTTDTSLFCLPVQANGADAFKLTLYHISRALQGVDARIVHILYTMR